MTQKAEKTNPQPVQSETERATSDLVTYSVNSYVKNCGLRATKCAESDLLGEALHRLKESVEALECVRDVTRKSRDFMQLLGVTSILKREIKEHRELLAKAEKKQDIPFFESGDKMLWVEGKNYRCECGCNVFRQIGKLKYRCNSCHAKFAGEEENMIAKAGKE